MVKRSAQTRYEEKNHVLQALRGIKKINIVLQISVVLLRKMMYIDRASLEVRRLRYISHPNNNMMQYYSNKMCIRTMYN